MVSLKHWCIALGKRGPKKKQKELLILKNNNAE